MTTIDAPEFAQTWYDTLEQKAKNPEAHRPYSTGLPEWDKLVGGIGNGWFVAIAARAKFGKSAMLATLLQNLARQGRRCMAVALEFSTLQYGDRVFSGISGVPMTQMRDISLTQTDWMLLREARDMIATWNMRVADDIATIDALRKAAEEYKPDVLLVDYFQLLETAQFTRSAVEKAHAVSRALKLMTKLQVREHEGVPIYMSVVVATQTSKKAAGDLSDPLYVSMYTGPEKDADVQFLIRDAVDEHGADVSDLREVIVGGSRVSATGSFLVRFHPARALFTQSELQVKDLTELMNERLEEKASPTVGRDQPEYWNI